MASTVAKTVVTQVMFKRFEVTTGNNPDRSGAFNNLAFLRGLLCSRITGFLCAMVVPVSERLSYSKCPSLYLGKFADTTHETLNSVG
jgi:hypothetical protein